MSQFPTIDATNLEAVTGGGLPIKPIINGVKAAYEVAKPWASKIGTGLNITGNVAMAGQAIHDTWSSLFGSKDQAAPQPTTPAPAAQPQAGGSAP
jgi:hypothetical protein